MSKLSSPLFPYTLAPFYFCTSLLRHFSAPSASRPWFSSFFPISHSYFPFSISRHSALATLSPQPWRRRRIATSSRTVRVFAPSLFLSVRSGPGSKNTRGQGSLILPNWNAKPWSLGALLAPSGVKGSLPNGHSIPTVPVSVQNRLCLISISFYQFQTVQKKHPGGRRSPDLPRLVIPSGVPANPPGRSRGIAVPCTRRENPDPAGKTGCNFRSADA